MANRIKFLFQNNNKKTETELLKILSEVCPELTPIDCYPGRGNITVVFCGNNDLNTVMNKSTIERLSNFNLEPHASQEFNAQRTLFLTGINKYITNFSPEELVTSFNASNGICKANFIIIIENKAGSHTRDTLKVILENKDQADHLLINGIWLKGMFIKQKFIHKERWSNITQCFKCFSYEHYANACKKTNQICSKCSGEHHFSTCTSTDIKCVNCEGKHIAIASSCPKRKEAINKLTSSSNGMSSAVPTSSSQQPIPNHQSQILTQPDLQSQTLFPPLKSKIPTIPSNAITAQSQPSQNTASSSITLSQSIPSSDPLITPAQRVHTQPQSQPQPPTPNLNTNTHTTQHASETPNPNHIWDLKLNIVKSYATMKANGDPEIFLDIMNAFLISINISPIELNEVRQQNNNCNTTDQQHSKHEDLFDLPQLSPLSYVNNYVNGSSPQFDTTPTVIQRINHPSSSPSPSPQSTITTTTSHSPVITQPPITTHASIVHNVPHQIMTPTTQPQFKRNEQVALNITTTNLLDLNSDDQCESCKLVLSNSDSTVPSQESRPQINPTKLTPNASDSESEKSVDITEIDTSDAEPNHSKNKARKKKHSKKTPSTVRKVTRSRPN